MFSAQGSQVSNDAIYVDDVFSTYLYTGNGSTQTINNGIDLAGKGGLVWLKNRTQGAAMGADHYLYDTARGNTKALFSDLTNGQVDMTGYSPSFLNNGFSIEGNSVISNGSYPFVSWTFRKQAKFFDVQSVTKTAGVAATVDLSSLGTVGCVIVKRTDSTSNWFVWHRSQTAGSLTYLNLTNAQAADSTISVSGTTLTIAASVAAGTYIVYGFAHNAGGFGASGTDNVISCGSYTGTGSATGPIINLGYEPQWLLIKETTTGATFWQICDNMRGFTDSGGVQRLWPNTADAEAAGTNVRPLAHGFQLITSDLNATGSTYIYIAIRRPHKPPTSGTQVFEPLGSQPLASGVFAHSIFTDFSFYKYRAGAQSWAAQDRLRGSTDLSFNSTAAEPGLIGGNTWDMMNGYKNTNPGAGAYASWAFKRAPGFFDQVCYTGTGAARTVAHNLGTVPELMIFKMRSNAEEWYVYSGALGANKYLILNTTAAAVTSTSPWNNTAPTASVFSLGGAAPNNTGTGNGTYVAYLFASLPGISKVGSYTGTGTPQTINCGFAAGARFVLIKRTDSTGDWYVWDTARGIVAANDPHLSLNTTAAEVTTDDSVDADPPGFIVNQVTATSINVSGATYIFLAIA